MENKRCLPLKISGWRRGFVIVGNEQILIGNGLEMMWRVAMWQQCIGISEDGRATWRMVNREKVEGQWSYSGSGSKRSTAMKREWDGGFWRGGRGGCGFRWGCE